jgi:hypothetical protein
MLLAKDPLPAGFGGLLGGVNDVMAPRAPAGAPYDDETARMARAALLGNLGGSLLAAAQGGQSFEGRARALQSLGQAPAAAAEIQRAGANTAYMGAQTQQLQQAARDRAASDAYYRGEAPAGGSPGGPAPQPTDPAAPGAAGPSIARTAAATAPAAAPSSNWLAQAAELGLSQQEAVRVAMLPYEQRAEVVKQLMVRQQERRSRYDVVESGDGSKERVYGDGRREQILGPQPKALDPNQVAGQEAELRREFTGNEAVKGFNQAQRSFSTMTDLVKRANESKPGAGVNDTALVFAFFKTIDPASTVREGEFASVAASMGLSEQVITALQRVDGKGFLTPDVRGELARVAETYLEKQYEDIERLGTTYRTIAGQRKLNAANVTPDPRSPETRARYEAKRVTPEQIAGATLDQLNALPPAALEAMSPAQRLAVRRRVAELNGLGQRR